MMDNKEEVCSRPINAFVDIFILSQSECVIGYYSGKNIHLNRKFRVLNKASRRSEFLNFFIGFNVTRKNKKISKNLPLEFAFYCLVLKLSALDQRRIKSAKVRILIIQNYFLFYLKIFKNGSPSGL